MKKCLTLEKLTSMSQLFQGKTHRQNEQHSRPPLAAPRGHEQFPGNYRQNEQTKLLRIA